MNQSRNGNMIGNGIYLSTNPNKSAQYSLSKESNFGLLLGVNYNIKKSKILHDLRKEQITQDKKQSIFLPKNTICKNGKKLIDDELCIYSLENVNLHCIIFISFKSRYK